MGERLQRVTHGPRAQSQGQCWSCVKLLQAGPTCGEGKGASVRAAAAQRGKGQPGGNAGGRAQHTSPAAERSAVLRGGLGAQEHWDEVRCRHAEGRGCTGECEQQVGTVRAARDLSQPLLQRLAHRGHALKLERGWGARALRGGQPAARNGSTQV